MAFQYYLCPGSMPHPRFKAEYAKVYQCWREVWQDAYQELKVSKSLYSDAFTRQDLVGSLFYQGECVALCFYRWADGADGAFSEDSYFSNWSPEHLQKLRSRGDRIIVCSNFTVHPAARGDRLGVSGKDLLMGMVVETFLNCQADAMTGAVRVNRKVNDASVRWGGYEIDREIPSGFGDANVDLIGFFKDHILKQPMPELKALTTQLWDERILIPRQIVEQEYAPNFSVTRIPRAA